MKTIYKYELSPNDRPVMMLAGAEVLTAREQGDKICVWAKVDTAESMQSPRTFHVIGTGHEIPENPNLRNIGTAILQGGGLVFHVFEDPFAQ